MPSPSRSCARSSPIQPDRRARFEREARAIASLNHPHICTLHDIGHQDGVAFLVMERLEGETLADRLVRGPLPFGEALACAGQVADALDRAHSQGIVHRDLKPANIMLTRSGVKLLDFGLARLLEAEAPALGSHTRTALTQEGTIVGTLQYMAPEQLEGKPTDARTDLFAFGAILYEMVTGRRAFDSPSQAGIVGAILHAEVPARRVGAAGVRARALPRVWPRSPKTAGPPRTTCGCCCSGIGAETASGDRDEPHAGCTPRNRRGWIAAALALAALVLASLVGGRRHRGARTTDVLSIMPLAGTTLRPRRGAANLAGRTRDCLCRHRCAGQTLLYLRARSSGVVRAVRRLRGRDAAVLGARQPPHRLFRARRV